MKNVKEYHNVSTKLFVDLIKRPNTELDKIMFTLFYDEETAEKIRQSSIEITRQDLKNIHDCDVLIFDTDGVVL